MENIDLTTTAGIAGFIGIFMQIVKVGLKKHLTERCTSIVIICLNMILAMGISFVVYWAGVSEDIQTIPSVLKMGLSSFLLAVGGYQGLKALMKMVFPKYFEKLA